jgi:hypothetical protein
VTPEAIAARAQCVHALLVRQQIEDALATGRAMDGPLERLLGFLEAEDLGASLDQEEVALLRAPAGEWTDVDVREAAWRIERLAVFLWALGRVELPEHGVPVEPDAVWAAIDLMGPTARLLEGASPRSGEAIDRQRRETGVWRWRVETELKHRAGLTPASGDPYEVMVRRAAERAASLVTVEDGDLVVRGARVAELSDARLHEAASAVLERDDALRWLIVDA